MNGIYALIVISIVGMNVALSFGITDSRDKVITAIESKGCESNYELTPSKTNIEAYNLRSLSGK
jgi:hypothetical protein